MSKPTYHQLHGHHINVLAVIIDPKFKDTVLLGVDELRAGDSCYDRVCGNRCGTCLSFMYVVTHLEHDKDRYRLFAE